MTKGEAVVEVRDLHKYFGTQEVLKGVSLTVTRGEAVSVVGRSGSGKTTLLRCINLLETPDRGVIRVGGRDTFVDRPRVRGRDLVQLRRDVGMLFQGFHLFPHLTAAENIALPLVRGAGIAEETALRRSLDLLDRVGLADKALEPPERLSGGQQQRVAIARALALQPIALLFDEPTSALDPESTADVLTVLRELSRDGITMIVVTHELSFAREVSSQLVMMSDGVIVESGDPADLIANPRHPRTREFMATYHGSRETTTADAPERT